jgi:arsenite-transporting ATPase
VAGSVRGAPQNLAVREIDAVRGFRQVRERYETAIDALFDTLTRGGPGDVGVDAGHDRRVMHDLIELAPPGIDELVAVIDVTDALDEASAQARGGAFDIVVMDTAPSGHALRLLQMPALVQDWARALMSILLKYQAVAPIGEIGSVLLKLSQGIGRLRALLTDPERMSFVAVTRAAALPRAETIRVIARLRRMHIAVPAVIVNAVGRGTCDRCRKASAAERREIARLRKSVGATRSLRIAIAPAEMPPPGSVAALRRWQRAWSGN